LNGYSDFLPLGGSENTWELLVLLYLFGQTLPHLDSSFFYDSEMPMYIRDCSLDRVWSYK